MRDTFSKLMTGSMVAAAALTLAACGGSETVETETNMVEMNDTMSMEGMANDMSAVDATMGSDANMAMDNGAAPMDANAM
jgi:hypothetical protein